MPCWRENRPFGCYPSLRDGVSLWEDTPGMYEEDDLPDKQSRDIYQAIIGRAAEYTGPPPQ